MEREVKSFGFETKMVDDNHFEGYASVFGNVDSHADIMQPGAFKKTIKEHASRVKVLWQHDPWQPIGVPVVMEEDSKGLYVKAKISQTEKGKETLILLKDGVINELSVGYNTVKEDWDKTRNVRLLKEVKLWEFSPVTFASNEKATITGVKSIAALMDELKAGRMLSAKNEGLVKSAIEALTALLGASEGGEEPPKSTPTETEKANQEAAEQIKAMMQEMSAFARRQNY
jgi:HK97 family phage prohead protease